MNDAITRLDAELFTRMIRGGASNLDANRKTVNELNVFPIPDGDTGDNMYMTFSAGLDELGKDSHTSLGEAAGSLSRGMLFGARGNSGVILSRIFSGLSKGLANVTEATPSELNEAMKAGVREAYSSVSDPVEGTILTVFRESVGYASERLKNDSTFRTYFEDLTSEMRRSLDRTPSLLSVLKESGVVDSGGAGLLYITEGTKSALEGGSGTETKESESAKTKSVDYSLFTENDVITFGYCTEFLLRLTNSKVDVASFDEKIIKDYLDSVGESVVCFREGSTVKAHVHVKTPGEVLNEVQKYGEFLSVKIENMNLQHSEVIAKRNEDTKINVKKHKPYGIVAVASGEGIKNTFRSLGVDETVEGGQSMNPSADDLLKAFSNVNADTIFVFPNNPNVILTAKQAAKLYGKADVRVIPTRSVGECYSAVSMLDTSSNDTDAIIKDTEEIINGVKTGAVAEASRDAQKDGFDVKKGDIIGVSGDRILSCAKDRNEALISLADSLNAGDYDIMLLICGKNVTEDEAKAVSDALKDRFPNCELYVIDGGQPVFDYLLTLE